MSLKIVFMSGDSFGVETLNELIKSDHKVVAVYTNPPVKSGRGNKIQKTEIHKISEDFGIKVITPNTFKDEGTRTEFLSIEHDIVVVVSYRFLLPEYVLRGKFQAINLHPSSLPRWRGAAPIERCIEAGDESSEICIMFMDKKLDAGNVIKRYKFQIDEKMNSKDVYEYCSKRGAKMIIETLGQIENENLSEEVQSEEGLTYAKKIEKSELLLDLNSDVLTLQNKIRAFISYGGCYLICNGERIKILQSCYEICNSEIGKIDEKFNINCKNGILKPLLIQREGRDVVKIDDFLRGWKLIK